MLTAEQCKKLGIPYLFDENDKINAYADALNTKLNLLKTLVPLLVAPPTDAQSAGLAGSIAIDSNYLYICLEENSWKRIPLKPI